MGSQGGLNAKVLVGYGKIHLHKHTAMIRRRSKSPLSARILSRTGYEQQSSAHVSTSHLLWRVNWHGFGWPGPRCGGIRGWWPMSPRAPAQGAPRRVPRGTPESAPEIAPESAEATPVEDSGPPAPLPESGPPPPGGRSRARSRACPGAPSGARLGPGPADSWATNPVCPRTGAQASHSHASSPPKKVRIRDVC